MASGNSWLARQRKSDLIELAEAVGLKDFESYRKSELELAIDEELSEHISQYQADPRFQDYFKSRARAGGSPVKKEALAAPEMKVSRRRAAKPVEEVAAPEEDEEEEEEDEEEDEQDPHSLQTQAAQAATATSTALARTPARAMALASRIQLPATPADVVQAVDRGTVAVRTHMTSLYRDSGLTEAADTARTWLSSVHSVVSAIALFELYMLRREVLPDRYAFTVPAVNFGLGSTPDYPVHLPDMFALVTAAFWGPALTWALTSVLLPSVAAYFFNLSAGAAQTGGGGGGGGGRGRKPAAAAAAGQVEYAVDPVMFSIVKAVVTYVVYAQGVTCGVVNPLWVSRINSALYSGWRGVLVGTAVSGVSAVYDAVLRK